MMRALVLVLSLFFITPVFADIYKWIDENGQIHITDGPSKIQGAKKNQALTDKAPPPTEISIEPIFFDPANVHTDKTKKALEKIQEELKKAEKEIEDLRKRGDIYKKELQKILSDSTLESAIRREKITEVKSNLSMVTEEVEVKLKRLIMLNEKHNNGRKVLDEEIKYINEEITQAKARRDAVIEAIKNKK